MTKFRKLQYHAALSGSENHRGYLVRLASSGHFVADVSPLDEDGKEGGAYARLFVEAPAMLAMLRLIAHGYGGWNPPDGRERKKLERIIARIDGGET